ncbi:MAG TPA: hypothetical protein DEG55_03015 [Acidaminococcaceae bacterium]|nr:hypothetical protein [Acidaminococcaceae bacterium]
MEKRKFALYHLVQVFPFLFSIKEQFWRADAMTAFPNITIKCRYEMLLKDKIITLSILINRKQAGKPHHDWSCEKNPVTEVTGRGRFRVLQY